MVVEVLTVFAGISFCSNKAELLALVLSDKEIQKYFRSLLT